MPFQKSTFTKKSRRKSNRRMDERLYSRGGCNMQLIIYSYAVAHDFG